MRGDIYCILEDTYGYQGWWPLVSKAGKKGYSDDGCRIRPGDFPAEKKLRFEIIAGAVLVQNTSWKNARKAVSALENASLLESGAVIRADTEYLAGTIRSAGYYNIKAKKLKKAAEFFNEYGLRHAPEREKLLEVWGIGPETADSILLYAFGKPFFVVDAYTRRFFFRLGIIPPEWKYGDVQRFFMELLKPDAGIYAEYHALIVKHAALRCRVKPLCSGCPFEENCRRLLYPETVFSGCIADISRK